MSALVYCLIATIIFVFGLGQDVIRAKRSGGYRTDTAFAGTAVGYLLIAMLWVVAVPTLIIVIGWSNITDRVTEWSRK